LSVGVMLRRAITNLLDQDQARREQAEAFTATD
jgi:hypothetical protein